MTVRDIIRRLAVAEATIRPANSMGARLKRLTPDQRSIYDQWRSLRDRWAARFDEPDGVYRAMLDDNYGPQLPASVQLVLLGEIPRLLQSDSEAGISNKWQKFLGR